MLSGIGVTWGSHPVDNVKKGFSTVVDSVEDLQHNIISVIERQCDGYVLPLSRGRSLPVTSLLSRSIHNNNILQLDSPRSKIHPSWSRVLSSTRNLQLGESVIGQVEDVIGSNKDPIVLFSIKLGGKVMQAKMPTKDLSPHERLAMQAGAVMQLQIADASESEIRVKLKSNDIESSTSNIPATPKRYKEPSFLLEDESLDELISSTAGSAPRSSNQPTNKKEKIQKTKMAKISSAPPVPGNLLNQLKTGRPLKGVVVSCTPYAAFVSTKVFRASRGGTYTEVNGMLHKNDISQEILDSQKRKLASMGNKVKGSQPDFLEKGTQLNVYVKEVFKNSGRFTLTTDSTIVKSKVLEIKEQTKTLSKERRHNRRLRRQLESIVAGDTVSGTVLKVTREGILVSISSLGSLN
eukprot:gene24700-32172_t